MGKMKKEKPRYSIFQNASYTLKDFWSWKPSMIWIAILHIPLRIVVPLLIALVPKIIIDMIEMGSGVKELLIAAPILIVFMILTYIAERVTMLYLDDSGLRCRFRYQVAIDVKTMEVDYEYMASNEGKNLREKAVKMVSEVGIPWFFRDIVTLLCSTLGLITYGSVLTALHPAILLLLIASYLITWYVNKKINQYEDSRRDEETEVFKGLRYLVKKAMDLSGAKDIRLYGIQGWFREVGANLIQKENGILTAVARRRIGASAISALLIFLRDGAAYAVLIYKVVQGDVSVSNFLVYFTMISTFADWLSDIISSLNNLDLENRGFCSYREYLEIASKSNTGTGLPLPDKEQWPCDLELQDVSYTYPGSETPTLSHINLKIKAGERIALVGLNGAGKTTLVKLLCGLLRPTEGAIRINGQDAGSFNRDDYFKLFSVIFQDVHLLPVSIAANITLQQEESCDRARLQRCIEQAGIAGKIGSLPNGLQTLLVKNVNEDAYELSGGETQKLLLARALYKEAPVLILDEPTAALDPIAENEMYLQYRDMTKDRTSVFISHRFASTRFCDRIVLLDQGQIAEEGSHEALMEQKGLYAKLFNVQSQYYQEGGDRA